MSELAQIIEDDGISQVAEWYGKRNVLVTGATGFLGKVLVERILRVSPPEKLYLLMRPKKGRCIKDRLEDFLNCQLFDGLRDIAPERLKNVHAVKGDVLQDELGISHQDRQELMKECHIIFHCAANVSDMKHIEFQREIMTLQHEYTINPPDTLSRDTRWLKIFAANPQVARSHSNVVGGWSREAQLDRYFSLRIKIRESI